MDFFIKRSAQIFMTHTCFYKLFLTIENKSRTPDTYYINFAYTNFIKYMKITSNLTQNRQKTQKAQKDKKLVFQQNW